MIAKQLEGILSEAVSRTDFSRRSQADLVQRFQSLREFGLLPRGRGKNAQHLTSKEVVSGILSVVPEKPGYAGTAAKILKNLRPVGSVEASFNGAKTFGEALSKILIEVGSLEAIVEVRASVSEFYTNNNGRAAILINENGKIRTAYFVSELATSLMGNGAEETFDPRSLSTTTVKETVFLPQFFKRISDALKVEYPEHAFDHLIDPDEEELERLKAERIKRLGITGSSNFLNIPVDTQVTWPNEEAVVEFAGKSLVLMPKTRETDTSIHIDLRGNRLTSAEAHTLINRMLSVMTWCDDQYCTVQDGVSGSRFPIATTKRNLAFATAYHWVFGRDLSESKEIRTALALYREGRNAEQNYLVAYAVLSYYKVIEVRHNGKSATKKWFKDTYPNFRDGRNDAAGIERFELACGDTTPHQYIYDACRVAVAHVNEKYLSDPDDFEELRRLHVVADVLRGLARYFIKNELGFSDRRFEAA